MEQTRITVPDGFSPEARAEQAKNNFLNGYNCCQSVVLAYCDVIGMDTQTAMSIASGFGGGMARMREVCGSVSAMCMIAGFISPAANPGNMNERTANYALVQSLAAEFRKENGSIVCKELLGLVPKGGAAAGCAVPPLESPVPSERTPEYYRKRPCADIVRTAALIVGRRIAAIADGTVSLF